MGDETDDSCLSFVELMKGLSVLLRGTVVEKLYLFYKLAAPTPSAPALSTDELADAVYCLYLVVVGNDYADDLNTHYAAVHRAWTFAEFVEEVMTAHTLLHHLLA